jgi:hypothetical protein
MQFHDVGTLLPKLVRVGHTGNGETNDDGEQCCHHVVIDRSYLLKKWHGSMFHRRVKLLKTLDGHVKGRRDYCHRGAKSEGLRSEGQRFAQQLELGELLKRREDLEGASLAALGEAGVTRIVPATVQVRISSAK